MRLRCRIESAGLRLRRAFSGGLIPVLMFTACAQYRSFAQLRADANGVPVPRGVTFVGEQQVTNDGPGFTTTKSEGVYRMFATALSCAELERAWGDTLRASRRRFQAAKYPQAFGSLGSLGIVITDRRPHLGITLGTDKPGCRAPFVYSFNPPH